LTTSGTVSALQHQWRCACLPPSCHSTFVFWANYGFTQCNNAVTRLNKWS
jgi:hypothetical protein